MLPEKMLAPPNPRRARGRAPCMKVSSEQFPGFSSWEAGYKVGQLGNELGKVDGVNATERRKNGAFWGVQIKSNPRRTRGRALWLKCSE